MKTFICKRIIRELILPSVRASGRRVFGYCTSEYSWSVQCLYSRKAKLIGLQISASQWHSCMACGVQQCIQGMEVGDVHPRKHNNNMHKKFISINDLYKFPVVLRCIFFLLSLFKDIFSAAPLSNLGLFQTDVFEVLCLCSMECVQEISVEFFFFPSYMNSHEWKVFPTIYHFVSCTQFSFHNF